MKSKSILNIIVNALLVITLITVAATIISYKLTGGEPTLFGYQFKVVLSGSMEPDIKTGSIIAVKPVEDTASLQINDVITYQSTVDNQSLITHRIVDIEGEGAAQQFITKGDNNDAIDVTPIPASYVVAKYANFTLPYAGYLVDFSKSKIGIIMLLIIPGLLIFTTQIINIWRIIANMKDDPEETASI